MEPSLDLWPGHPLLPGTPALSPVFFRTLLWDLPPPHFSRRDELKAPPVAAYFIFSQGQSTLGGREDWPVFPCSSRLMDEQVRRQERNNDALRSKIHRSREIRRYVLHGVASRSCCPGTRESTPSDRKDRGGGRGEGEGGEGRGNGKLWPDLHVLNHEHSAAFILPCLRHSSHP